MADMMLKYPYFLLFIPLFVVSAWYFKQEQHTYLIPHLSRLLPAQKKKDNLRVWLKWTMIISGVIALSNPSSIQNHQSIKRDSMDIVLVVDTSGSMDTKGFNESDYTQSRLSVVQEVLQDFMQKRSQDRIALVVFGSHSAVAAPLSFQTQAQKDIVQSLHVGMLGKSTAIIDALVRAEMLLKTSKSRTKVIILLSDGEDEMSRVPVSFALSFAQKEGIKVYTVLIDKSASNLMKVLARESGTEAYEAASKKDLARIYHDIDKLEKGDVVYETVALYSSWFMPFLMLAVFCGLWLLLRNSRGELS